MFEVILLFNLFSIKFQNSKVSILIFLNFICFIYFIINYHAKIRLYRHKEQLKKDILKKRVLLEKELQIEIQKELASELATRTKPERNKKQEELRTSTAGHPNNTNIGTKRKSGAGGTGILKSLPIKTGQQPQTSLSGGPPNERQKPTPLSKGRKSQKGPGSSKKKEKLYCICRTPYDESK